MAMRMGAGRKKQAESILAHSFAMLTVFSVLLTILFLLSKRPSAELVQAQAL